MTKSWQDKYDSAKASYSKVNDKKFADLEAGTSVLIPSPADIDAQINTLGSHETLVLGELRNRLADAHGADGTCPVMCGMNLRIVAEVAYEALDAGVPANQVTPVWKVIDPTSALATKLAGGPERVLALRASAVS